MTLPPVRGQSVRLPPGMSPGTPAPVEVQDGQPARPSRRGDGRVLARIFPLGVIVASPEGSVTPFWILEPEMGRGELGDGEEEEGGTGHVCLGR